MNEMTNFPELQTDRLLLRPLVKSDANALFEIFSSDNVTKYYGMFPISDIQQSLDMIANFQKGFEEERVIRWGIEEKQSGNIIGTCGYHCWNRKHFRAEIGYELAEAHWHKGYMVEAVSKIIEYGFDAMDLNRIEGIVYPQNQASKNALKKLGFTEEGLLREYMCFRGQMTDLLMFSLLKREFAGIQFAGKHMAQTNEYD